MISLGETFGARLGGVGQGKSKLAAVAQEPLEKREVFGRGDEQNLADARQHEHRERVVNHRLVIHGHELLAHGDGEGVEAGARASGEDDAFAGRVVLHGCGRGRDALLRGAEAGALVAVLGDVVCPVAVGEIPIDGFGETGFERLARGPSELGLDF